MKKIPLRKCLATQEQFPKKELIRIVKNNNGEVFIDETGRANGRGAYLNRSVEAVNLAQSKRLIDRALETKVPDELYQKLKELVSK